MFKYLWSIFINEFKKQSFRAIVGYRGNCASCSQSSLLTTQIVASSHCHFFPAVVNNEQ